MLAIHNRIPTESQQNQGRHNVFALGQVWTLVRTLVWTLVWILVRTLVQTLVQTLVRSSPESSSSRLPHQSMSEA